MCFRSLRVQQCCRLYNVHTRLLNGRAQLLMINCTVWWHPRQIIQLIINILNDHWIVWCVHKPNGTFHNSTVHIWSPCKVKHTHCTVWHGPYPTTQLIINSFEQTLNSLVFTLNHGTPLRNILEQNNAALIPLQTTTYSLQNLVRSAPKCASQLIQF